MTYLTIITVILAIIFFTRYLSVQRQLSKMSNDLKEYNIGKSKQKIEVSFGNKQIEKLAIEINELIDQKDRGLIEKKRKELELKRTISGISHDLRTPLTSIIGYLQYLEQEELLPKERADYTAISREKALSLQVLIQNIFLLSTTDSGDYPLKTTRVNATKAAKEVILSHYDLFTEKHFSPVIHIRDEALFIYMDEGAFKRVIENIILNAIQHGAGNIEIALHEKNGQVEFIVKNGLKADEKPDVTRLFERSYTADESRKNSHGLGLAIVKSMMDRIGGEVAAQVDDSTFMIACRWKVLDE